MSTPTIRDILRDAHVKLACMKAALYDDLIASLEQIVDTGKPSDPSLPPTARPKPAPAFSDAALAAMEALAAGETAPTHDPLAPVEAAPQPAVTTTTTPDPLDAPKPRRGGRRSRGGEGSPQAETPPETQPQPEPQPDDLDLPGEPLSDAAPEAGPAPDATPSADPVDALFGSPGDDFDPLA